MIIICLGSTGILIVLNSTVNWGLWSESIDILNDLVTFHKVHVDSIVYKGAVHR